MVVEGNLLCGETRGPGPGLAAGQCPAVRTVKGRTGPGPRSTAELPLVEGDAGGSNGGRADIEAVKLHVLHGWPRWWAWTFASLLAQIAIGILEAAAGELVIVDHDVGETIH